MPLNYKDDAPPINLITDACTTGIAGIVSQGNDWKTATVAAFFSAKLNSAQQNYPMHELEMFAGVETMKRHCDILYGTKFRWFTDHKALIHLLDQKNLSGRQARWIEAISEFNFEIIYIEGSQNILSDALSRIYSNDAPGTVCSPSEYPMHDEDHPIEEMAAYGITMPVLVGLEANAVTTCSRSGAKAVWTPKPKRTYQRRLKTLDKPDETYQIPPEAPIEPMEGMKGGEGSITTPIASTTSKQTKDSNTNEKMSEGQRKSDHHEPIPEKKAIDCLDETATDGSLVNTVSSKLQNTDLLDVIRHSYEKDVILKKIIEKPKDFCNFIVENRLIYLKESYHKLLCIPEKVMVKGHALREIIISEGHSLLAHLGASKTIAYLRDHVWWKSMNEDIRKFCDTCTTCKRSKPSNQKPYGLLNPLDLPTSPWESIGIDFLGPLPESSDRDATYDSITVIIDLLTAMVHLIPSRTDYTAPQLAELIFAEVYKHHGLPKNIISDRDVLFTSNFWQHLHSLLGVKLRMSSAYHPETDGSTERANRTITQMIRQCISPDQKDWVQKLPGIQIAINLARNDFTGYSPFFLNTGRIPRNVVWNSPTDSQFPGVVKFAQRVKHALMTAHDSLIAARVKQTRDANRHRRPVPFKEEDLVYISTKNLALKKGLA
jgi:transposase InsO family protein